MVRLGGVLVLLAGLTACATTKAVWESPVTDVVISVTETILWWPW